jgi:hypothetical protein
VISALIAVLLVTIIWQLAMIIRRADRSALIAAATKIHIREAKEEHWAQLSAIREILLARIAVDPRVPDDRKKILMDTPEQLGEHGHWWYHMPNNYLESDWQGYQVLPDEHRLRGRQEAAERVLKEAGRKPRS